MVSFKILAILGMLVMGVKKKTVSSSLFQTWAQPPPYMYPNYMQPQGYPGYPGYYPPMNYYPQGGPPPGYFQQQEYQPYPPYPYQANYQPPQVAPPVVGYQMPPVMTETAQPATITQTKQMEMHAPPEVAVLTPVVPPITTVEAPTQTTPSPMKQALSKAMNEAMKQMDKVTDSALDLTTFDNLHYSPTATQSPVRLSLSQDTVPIDNHILNWRELVGLPSSNSITDEKLPVTQGSTPLLSGKW